MLRRGKRAHERTSALRAIAASAALAVALAIGGASVSAARADDAADNYATNCARCHGAHGQADGPSVPTLTTTPQKFTDCAQMAKISDQKMFNAIKNGGPAVGLPMDMPSWNNDLDDDEIRDLVKFIRAFCRK